MKARNRRAMREVGVEALEARQVLSLGAAAAGLVPAEVQAQRVAAGTVVKVPRFYQFYAGPRRADLDVASGGAVATPGKSLVLTGVMAGAIDAHPAHASADSSYVFGINRGSPGAVAPFFQRPGVRFDAVVTVKVAHVGGISATVVDLVTGKATRLPLSDVAISGRTVRVSVPLSLLPTPAGGVSLGRYTFNLWPESDPLTGRQRAHASDVASFLPESSDAPIAVLAAPTTPKPTSTSAPMPMPTPTPPYPW